MVTLEKIQYRNYMNVIDQEVPLKGQGLVFVVGKNGSGKSSMFIEGIYYALYGRSFKYKNPVGSKIVREACGDEDSYVKLWLNVDGVDYEIVRARKSEEYPEGLSLFSGGLDLSRGTSEATQRFITELLGMGPSAFEHSVVFSAKILKFPMLKDSEKKAIFDEILQLEVLNKGLEDTKQVIKNLNGSKSILTERKRMLKQSLSDSKEELTTTQRDLSLWEGGREDRIKALKETIKGASVEVKKMVTRADTLRDKLDIKKNELSKLRKVCNKMQELVTEEFERTFEKEVQYTSGEFALTSAQKACNDEKSRLKKMVAQGKCGVCFQATTNATFEDEFSKINKKLKDLVLLAANLAKSREELDEAKDQINEAKSQLAEERAKIDPLERIVDSLDSDLEVLDEGISDAKKDLKVAEGRLESESSAENPYKPKLDGIIQRITDSEAGLSAAEDELNKVMVELESEDVIVKILGPKGARLHMISAALPMLNAEAEKTQLLMGTHLSVKFKLKSSTEAYGGNLVTEVFNPRGAASYEGDSAGEQACVDWILLLSMLGLVSSRGAKSFSQAFYDEVFDTLDEGNEMGVLNVLKDVSQTKSSVFILSHSAGEVGGQCDRVWTVDNGTLIREAA
jgi:DNA repair exonuclease SbcCD ATPase subunit